MLSCRNSWDWNIGSFQIRNEWGVKVACGKAVRSLDCGRDAKTVQFGTVKNMQTFIYTYSHASRDGMGCAFMSDNGTSACISNSTMNLLWFKRFMQGLHQRMGNVWLQDKSVSRYVIRACFSGLEENWVDNYSKLSISKAVCIILTGCYGGLRGEKLGKTHLGVIKKY